MYAGRCGMISWVCVCVSNMAINNLHNALMGFILL